MQRLQKWLVLTHRWLAIVACLLIVAWFVSGLVLMYVGFPTLTDRERTEGLAPIEWSKVRVTPAEALLFADIAEFPRDLTLSMMDGEPVYRAQVAGAAPISVSAVSGRGISAIDASQAVRIAAQFRGWSAAVVTRTVTRDQWTVSGEFNAHRPLHVVQFDDAGRTHLYVSSRTGEVVLDTTARERGWNWIGAVTHWLYFSELRERAGIWRQVVLWLSGVGMVIAISGIWLGIDRLRLRRQDSGSAITPFRGWMAWHHIAGVLGGVFVLTWIFSGWLSMDPPGPWSSEVDAARMRAGLAAYRGHDSNEFPTSLQALHGLDAPDARTASLRWVGGDAVIVTRDRHGLQRVIAARTGLPSTLDTVNLTAAARNLIPGSGLIDATLLTQEDAYWYSHRTERTLPVLRLRFDDPQRTWIYLDPVSGALLARCDTAQRMHRWLFNGLHSFDFRWLRTHRPLWDIVVWTLSAAGLLVSLSGVVIGWRRLRN
jgi:PepSY-associated TM region